VHCEQTPPHQKAKRETPRASAVTTYGSKKRCVGAAWARTTRTSQISTNPEIAARI
jgi:hypothetical protein